MATIRDCFLIDISIFDILEVVYCSRLKNTQDQLKKYKQCCIPGIPDIIDKSVYTSNIMMDLKKTITKFRKAYVQPNVPKIVVDSG